MLRRPTTFIIGAGSSCELGLPSGLQLKSLIADLLQSSADNFFGFTDDRLQQAFRNKINGFDWKAEMQMGAFKQAARKIRAGLPMALSIDNYLHTHQANDDVVKIGKLAITTCILQAERESSLFVSEDSQSRVASDSVVPITRKEFTEGTWFANLAGLLFSQVDAGNPAKAFDGVSFIVFNYDRCLEQFLWLSLRAYFGLSMAEAADLLSGVCFIHPYGTVGRLPWQSGGAVPFGSDFSSDLFSASSQLKTFTESVDSEISSQIDDAVSAADDLIVLGFGYLDQNVALMRAAKPRQLTRILTTAFGLSSADQEVVYSAIASIAGLSVGAWDDRSRSGLPAYLDGGTCRNLMDHHHLLLTLG